ncbi:MAG TPA: TQO small subunit DoxD [Pyrinomonadaceae bacterium]|nr:TQO small subunit DoxD [Pyrinomonadaceae bacterium]
MHNPFSDFWQFLLGTTVWGRAPLYVFILLLVLSTLVALYNFWSEPKQRTLANFYTWLARLAVGSMWFQQTLWKLPPTFTDNPDGVTGGLRYWMGEIGKHAAFGFHASLVNNVMLPHFKLFAAQVWAAETFIALSLMLGLFTRLGSLLGALMALNLWLGLYNAPNEWPWTYFFLLLLMLFFFAVRAGRALGMDALLAPRVEPRQASFWQRTLELLS